MLGRLIQPELLDLLDRRDWRALREVLVDLSVADVADVLAAIGSDKDRALVFRLLPRDDASDVFEHLEAEEQEALLNALKDGEAARILNDMAPDDRTELLEEMPDSVARRVLRLLSPEERAVSTALLAYPEGSVGRKMTPEYVKVKEHLTCAECIEKLRRVGAEMETVYYVYAVDERNVPIGVVSLRELLFSPPDRKIRSLFDARDELVKIRADASQAEAVRLLRHYDLMALPVVDGQDRLVGIVTFDDLMDVQEQAATEEMQMLSGVVPTEGGYLASRFTELFPKRLVALVVLAVTATFCGLVIDSYSEELAEFGSLALFIVVLMAASGNTGSQAGTLVIRALATETFDRGGVARVARREVGMGIMLGLALGLVVAGLGLLIFDVRRAEALVVGGALATAVATCNLIGAFLPVALKALGIDPAMFATPLITTLSDYCALFVYFQTARTFLAR